MKNQETLEEAIIREFPFDKSYKEREAMFIGAKWQQEQDKSKYSEEDLKEILTKLSLVNPSHLKMTIDGYGEFPDSYKLTEKGVNHIIEQFKKK